MAKPICNIWQDDDDGHLLALQICQDLLLKQKDIFLDHFARLGIFHKVMQLVGNEPQSPKSDNEEDETDKGVAAEEKVRSIKFYDYTTTSCIA